MNFSRRINEGIVVHAIFEDDVRSPDVSWDLFLQTRDKAFLCGYIFRTSVGIKFGGWNEFLESCKQAGIESAKVAPFLDSIIDEIDANEAVYEVMTS